LARSLAEADHHATVGAMIADRPGGRVLGHRRPLIGYRLGRRDAGRIRRAMLAAGRVLFAAGASEVLTGLPGGARVTGVGGLADAIDAARPGEPHLAAFHPTGTAAMGADPPRHPVDPSGRLRGADNVYVVDASVLPSCPTVNPQLSIMAMALAISTGI
jgi:choline dehydrogenase-like flavoprotein